MKSRLVFALLMGLGGASLGLDQRAAGPPAALEGVRLSQPEAAPDRFVARKPGPLQPNRRSDPRDPNEPAPVSGEGLAGPAVLEIRSVPAMAAIRFTLDGRPFETDEDGVARIRVWWDGVFDLEALVEDSSTSERRLTFARWGDAVFTPRRQLYISESMTLEAGFDVHVPVRFRFGEHQGKPVPPARVASLILRNSLGDVYAFAGPEAPWLQAVHVIGRDLNLEAGEVVYTVQKAEVDGSNVVNRGQQRFVVGTSGPPEIELLLYSAQVTARDALFGFPIGGAVFLTYPDGRTRQIPLDETGRLRLNSLARGTYRARVIGAFGISPPSVFVLSRDQEVRAVVISALDLLVMVVLGASFALGLLLVGRPALRNRLRSRILPSAGLRDLLTQPDSEADRRSGGP